MRSRSLPALIGQALAAAALIVAALAGSAAAGSRKPENRELAAARAATARFHRVAAAEAAGYQLPPAGPLHFCIDEDVDLIDGNDDPADAKPAMGLHYINGSLLDSRLDPAEPEALVYEPTTNGRLRLVALEYVVFAADWAGAEPPRLFGDPGQAFNFTDEPNRFELPPFYSLHAWVWKHNPAGTYAMFNPRVSCAHAT